MQQPATQATTPQGHMSLKSSLYAIGNAKWITQRLVQDHMDAHYRKLSNAKPAIDTRIPKSSIASVKARDSWKRKTGNYPAPPRNSRPSSAIVSRTISRLDDHGSTGQNDFSDELQSILSYQDVGDTPKLTGDFEKRKQTPTQTWSPSTALSLNTPPSVNGSAMRTHTSLSHYGLGGAGVIYKTGRHRQLAGDHLDRFADRFKETGEFQPRLLKKTAQSWLAASKHYVPPRQCRVGSSTETAVPSAPNNPNEPSSKPPLAKSDSVTGTPPKTQRPTVGIQQQPSTATPPNAVAEKPVDQVEDQAFANATSAFDKLNDEACVKFIAEVTQDILSRGVFTDRVIENVMQEHYRKQMGKMNERKLQLAMSSLREDFGLNETGHEKDAYIAAQEQYFASPSQHSKPESITSASGIMTPTASSTLIESLPSKRMSDLQPVESIDQPNNDDELNKTVDELMTKINELETRSSEKGKSAEAEVLAKEVTTTAEQPINNPETERSKSAQETGDYEEDFE